MDNQLAIKILLLLAFGVLSILLILPSKGQRGRAIRTILVLLGFGLVLIGIVFPEIVSGVASNIGVGRGTDLILYVLVVVFIGESLSMRRKIHKLQQEITEITRFEAINNPSAEN